MNSLFFTKIYKIILPLMIAGSVLFYLPMTPNFFTSAKILLFIIALAAMLVGWGISVATHREIVYTRTSQSLLLILLILAVVINFFTNREGWLEALTGRGVLYIGGALLAFLASTVSSSRSAVKWVIYSLIGSSAVLAIHSLLQLTVLYRLESLPTYMATRAFTPTGSPLTTLTILIIGAVATFYYASRALKGSSQYGFFVMGTVQTIAVVAYLSLMLPGSALAPNLLPYQASWAVTLDALKTPRSILFGVGLANFSQLFASVKPLSLNSGLFWNIVPQAASSELLQLLATGGVLILSTFLLLPLTVFKQKRSHSESTRTLMIIFGLSLLALVLTPISIPVIILFFITLGLLAEGELKSLNIPKTGAAALAGFIFLSGVSLSYFGVRAFTAENQVFRSQIALAAGDGRTVYEHSLTAVKLMPSMANYHLAYSQVNLSLASALSQKKDLTDQDREQVSALIQQAIREAKAAAQLRQHDTRNWQNLGSIYRNLVNVAEGSDQFAVSSYAQAVALDPANPALRVEYGGLLYQLAGNTKDESVKNNLLTGAVQQFQTAVQLKSDYANAYYNLSKALEVGGNIQGAYLAMQKVVASLDPNSADLGKATTDLETLKNKLPKASPSPTPEASESQTSELVAPSPLPSPISGGPLPLSDESPAPSPSVTPSPSPET